MPKFHSLRSVYPPRTNDEPEELLPVSHKAGGEDIFNRKIELQHPTAIPTLSGEQYSQTNPLTPSYISQPVQPSSPTRRAQTRPLTYEVFRANTERALLPAQPSQPQSLLAALQLTMEPKTNRLPVVIPAEMKKRKQSITEGISPATRRTISRFKMGVVLGAMVAFTFLTAFSFGPLNQGKPLISLFNNGIQLSQPQGPNTALSQSQQGTPVYAQPVAVAPAMPNIPQNNLVTLAQNDAIKYGISPVYFVRQIYVESGFNPNAYSPAGAVGIAQFLPSTAYGLGINPYDPVSALDGAAKYMAGLSNQFGGDYAKALAAYNAGSGAVQSAVNSAGANWLSLMPYETQVYVNKIMG